MLNKRTLAPVLLLVGVILAACTFLPINRIVGSGTVVDRAYDLADFNSLSATNAFVVEVTQGDAFAVTVHTDDNLLDVLNVRVEDGTLYIALQEGTATSNATLQADVTMPAISGVAQSGATNVTLTGFGTQPETAQPEFAASLDGASVLTGTISADAVTLALSGGSRATLTGEGDLLAADISGASYANLEGFSVESATLSLEGASDANVTVSGTLDVSASGASEVIYGGGATLGTSSLSGASTVTER